jgi:hypothetical protein
MSFSLNKPFSLNYVWFQAVKRPTPDAGERITCPIPNALMNNVRETAKRFPLSPINIWADIYGVGNNSNRIMQALNDQESIPNICFKPLDDIPVYTTNPLFELPFDGFDDAKATLWRQVDLSRLYALREALVQDPSRSAIYADMDVIIPHTGLNILTQQGMVTNASAKMLDGLPLSENQFFGFSQQHLGFLLDELLPVTAEHIQQGDNGWHGHAKVFANASDALKRSGIDYRDIICSVDYIADAMAVKKSYQSTPRFSNP